VFDWSAYLLALTAICSIAVATWIASLFKRDVSIVDSIWSVLIWAAGIVYIGTTPDVSVRGWLMIALLTLWAVRLSVYITARNWGEPEDRRYQNIRANHQPNFALKSLYIVFLLQGMLAWVVSLPLLAAAHGAASLGIIDMLGAALALFGFTFEAIADWQLSRFKARPDSRGRVLSEGLWRYSRHPNYFGECCTWWGFWLIALSAGGWWSIASPILMTILLLRVSGVTLLEREIHERRPEYAQYIKRTNAFLPCLPRE
jgi:steroid 5-alpha reductase family enzyme